ncbi:hypothetical protein M768_15190 [Cellulosimicrobium cellulans F16]|uniref:Uncharacterized protein n=1 Tax=Cellulosimicrobium cellulans F16 TaxID=1350482 RepID=A0A0M0F415_CELCE|nr:hypothetical protein M768_15190 [Cellulosimicrobium cellulans F16]
MDRDQGTQEHAARLRADDHGRRRLAEELRQSRTQLGEQLSVMPPPGRISADVGIGPVSDPAKTLPQVRRELTRSSRCRPLHLPLTPFPWIPAEPEVAQSSIEYMREPVTFS